LVAHFPLVANSAAPVHVRGRPYRRGRSSALYLLEGIKQRLLVRFEGGKEVPATHNAIADAVRRSEEIIKAIDERWPPRMMLAKARAQQGCRAVDNVRLRKGVEGMYPRGCYGFFLAGKYFFSIDATTT
jgi:hypothetical protein